MKIALGIILWNEEKSIGLTIDSLFEQTLFTDFQDTITSIKVMALANGCTDNSVSAADVSFRKNLENCPLPYVEASVVELEKKGKTNAWNSFVHELTDADTEYLFLMDGDISINNVNTCKNMLLGLEQHPQCHVASSLAIKDTELTGNMNFFERITLRMTRLEHAARLTYLCGGLYAGRAVFFRSFLFPAGFVCGDDGFIVTMAITNLRTTDFEFHRVYQTPDATFVFETYSSPVILFRQHVRREIGSIVREMIIQYVDREIQKRGGNAGEILITDSRDDPEWLLRYQEQVINDKGFWVIPIRRLTLRFSQLRGKSLGYRLKKLPLVIAGTLWLAAVVIVSNRKIQRREFLTVWLNNPNKRMVANAAR